MRKMPVLCDKEKCTGCMACYNICPLNAIEIEKDVRGFSYPTINAETCVSCLKCEMICPALHPLKKGEMSQEYYAFKHCNHDIRLNSSSGGFFTWISDIILKRNGVIYGACYDVNMKVVHRRAESENIRNSMRGSKYVQSDINCTYKFIKKDIENGRWVLFSGTPCQCEALYAYLGDGCNIEKLITMDFICEGVVSPQIFEDFKKFEGDKYKKEGNLISITFRDKERYKYKQPPIFSRRLVMEFKNENGNTVLVYDGLGNSRYLDCMFSGLTQRESCLTCKFNSYERVADFTCGDFHRYHGPKKFKDSYGLSEVLVNSEKARMIVKENIDNEMFLRCNKEESWQPLLSQHLEVNITLRDRFWRVYKSKGYKKATDIIMPKVYKRIVRRKLEYIKQKLLFGGRKNPN